MYLVQNYNCLEWFLLTDPTSKRLKNVIDQYFDKTDNDFNLTNMIIDFKERQQGKIERIEREGFKGRGRQERKESGQGRAGRTEGNGMISKQRVLSI